MGKIFKKVFKDPLYDYIRIDNNVCEKIIDDKYFQRLRRIEQTSMRCLYPSARHDRFIHSIGVYHLAKVAIRALKRNKQVVIDYNKTCVGSSYKFPTEQEQETILFSFEMAALLHDVCHSPFSHTLESYFKDIAKKDVDGNISTVDILDEFFQVAEEINSISGEEDFESFKANCRTANATPHEIASCILIFKCFRDKLEQIANERNEDSNRNESNGIKILMLFLARCILGAQYTNYTDLNGYKNCIIKLLNSSIDVDKLDYIARDSAVSGFANTMVDTKRLLGSLVFALYNDTDRKQKICLAFQKTAVGVIQNVVMSRNALYTWIYSHHKVSYESYLIKQAVKKISEQQKNPKEFITKYFSPESVEKNLVCDDVIWNLFLENRDIPEVNAVISRKDRKKAIWKSFAEFQAYFSSEGSIIPIGDFSTEQMVAYLNRNEGINDFEKYINEFTTNDGQKFHFDIVINKTKLTHIEHNSIMIYINNKLYSFDTIFNDLYKKAEVPPFFYLYCSKEEKTKLSDDNYKYKNALIKYIKQYEQFRLIPR